MDDNEKIALLMRALELAAEVMSYSRGDAWERECTQAEYDEFRGICSQLVKPAPAPMLAAPRRSSDPRKPTITCKKCGVRCCGERGLMQHTQAKHPTTAQKTTTE